MKKLSEKEIDDVFKSVKATMEIEGLKVTDDAEVLAKKVLRGELNGDEAIEIIKAKYTNYFNELENVKCVEFEREEPYL